METFYTKATLQQALGRIRSNGQKIALIPTMGALHEGHLSLIEFAKAHSDITICSIFVNPTQFNDPEDLKKYPRPIEQDKALLEEMGCDIVFLPTVEEMYPSADENWHIDLHGLDEVWEGKHRPGHFQGVTQIVYKLFNLVQPDSACFGQKDFQQIMVIQRMLDVKKLPIELLICPTIRNTQGLALSSRNQRLSVRGQQDALVLSAALRYIQQHFTQQSTARIISEAKEIVSANTNVTLEYLAICDTGTLQPLQNAPSSEATYVTLIAAWVENVRLIDNVLLSFDKEPMHQIDIKA